MAENELDKFLNDDDDWVSDTGSVEQDHFNKSKFDKVEPVTEPLKPVNARDALSLENEELKEEEELKQAKELNPPKSSPKPKTPAATPPPKPAAVLKKPSITNTPKPSVVKQPSKTSVVKQPVKPSEIAKKPSIGNKPAIVKKPSMSAAAAKPASKTAPKIPEPTADDKPVGQPKYGQDIIKFFDEVNEKPITQQAIEYLNAYWDEIGDQAEFIFSVSIVKYREADMHRKGIVYKHLYDEGTNVDYPTYLYFYEKLVHFVDQNPQWRSGQYQKSAVYEVKTAVQHKNDLKEKVDVNFDGKISFLEFLLYQYSNVSNPVDYMQRVQKGPEEHAAIIAAREALKKVNERVRAFEQERIRLQEGAKQQGVKGLTFKHQLSVLEHGVLWEKINEALITAEAAVRIAVRKFQGQSGEIMKGANVPQGALWWMQRDLEEKKRVVIPATLRRLKKNRPAVE